MPDLLKEFLTSLVFVICIPLSFILIKTGIKIARSDKATYERNRRASMLARKYSRGKKLEPEEERMFQYYVGLGVIEKLPPKVTKKGKWKARARLSNYALDEITS